MRRLTCLVFKFDRIGGVEGGRGHLWGGHIARGGVLRTLVGYEGNSWNDITRLLNIASILPLG